MSDYIGGREVLCRPAPGGRHRCEVDGWDLSEVVLFNGGGRATADAPADYVKAERKERTQRRGTWADGQPGAATRGFASRLSTPPGPSPLPGSRRRSHRLSVCPCPPDRQGTC